MSSVNKVILIGRAGKDAESKTLEGGQVVANFSLATDEYHKKADGTKVQETEWHSIILWGKLAENAAKYITKGRLLYVEGKVRSRIWKNKDGTEKKVTEIIANNFELLDPKGKSEKGEVNGNTYSSNGHESKVEKENNSASVAASSDAFGDDLPF